VAGDIWRSLRAAPTSNTNATPNTKHQQQQYNEAIKIKTNDHQIKIIIG